MQITMRTRVQYGCLIVKDVINKNIRIRKALNLQVDKKNIQVRFVARIFLLQLSIVNHI